MARPIQTLTPEQTERAHAEGFAIVPDAGGLVPHGSIFQDAAAVRAHLRARAAYRDTFACAALLASTPYGAPAAMPRMCPDDGGRLYGVALGVSDTGLRAILYIPGVGLRHCPAHELEPAHAWEVAACAGWEVRTIGANRHTIQRGSGESFEALPGMFETARDALGAAFGLRLVREATRAYGRVYGQGLGYGAGAQFDVHC